MTFISSYDKTERFSMPDTKKGIEDVYEKQVNKDGAVLFVKTGERNLYEEIQSYKDDCDINFIIARCVKDGSVSLLADNGRSSVDVSMLPDNFLDLYNLSERLKNEFLSLPVEEREAFNHSPILYIDSRINGSAEKIISDHKSKLSAAAVPQEPAEAPQSEVKKDE